MNVVSSRKHSTKDASDRKSLLDTKFYTSAKTRSRLSAGSAGNVRSDDVDGRFQSTVTDTQQGEITGIVRKLMEPGKGIVAFDEIEPECRNVLRETFINLHRHEKNKDPFVAFIEGCKEIEADVSGLLFDDAALTEFIGKARPAAIVKALSKTTIRLGVKVDEGFQAICGTHEEVTSTGLDSLSATCRRFKAMGCAFTEWKFPVTFSEFTPSFVAYHHNAALASRFANISMRNGLVPIISLEITETSTIDGLDLYSSMELMQDVLAKLIKTLADYHVKIEGVILRMSPLWIRHRALRNPKRTCFQQLALAMWTTMIRRLPPSMGGLVLSDSRSFQTSTRTLNELHVCPCLKPFPVTYCWGRVFSEGNPDVPDPSKAADGGEVKATVDTVDCLKNKLTLCHLAAMGQLNHASGSVFVKCISSYPTSCEYPPRRPLGFNIKQKRQLSDI